MKTREDEMSATAVRLTNVLRRAADAQCDVDTFSSPAESTVTDDALADVQWTLAQSEQQQLQQHRPHLAESHEVRDERLFVATWAPHTTPPEPSAPTEETPTSTDARSHIEPFAIDDFTQAVVPTTPTCNALSQLPSEPRDPSSAPPAGTSPAVACCSSNLQLFSDEQLAIAQQQLQLLYPENTGTFFALTALTRARRVCRNHCAFVSLYLLRFEEERVEPLR